MLDWEENLFLGLKAIYRRIVVSPKENRLAAVRATLTAHRGALRLVAAMISERNVGLLETPDPTLYGTDRIFLPPEMSGLPTVQENTDFYLLRTVVAALALREGWHRNGTSLEQQLRRCGEEFPHLESRLAALATGLPSDRDRWSLLGALPDPDTPPKDASLGKEAKAAEPALPDSHPTTTEIEGQGRIGVEIKLDPKDDGEGADLPTHTFEKVETLDEYTGMSRKSDRSDELAEHGEALSELKMTQLLRSPERPRSIYRSDVMLEGWGSEQEDQTPGRGIPYPEWDYQRKTYRPRWCFVNQTELTRTAPDWLHQVEQRHQPLIHKLRRQFHSLTREWLRQRRQTTGTEFDLDALIESETERRSSHTPMEAIYLNRKRDLHDIAALVLLDVSYSTDAWIDNRRVLDVIRETVFCVGEVLEDYVEQFGIATFTSNTRRACSFEFVKPLAAPWRQTRGRLGAIEPRGYTRIGPALRHAQEQLLDAQASRKIVILVTDGRPCDYDRYEGQYGLMDVRKAIETGKAQGIRTHAFAVEKRAAESLPQMFTRHRYDIVPRPEILSSVMCRLFASLLAE